MSEKKNLIVPKLQKQNLGKVNPQKAEYLYISKEFCKEGLFTDHKRRGSAV